MTRMPDVSALSLRPAESELPRYGERYISRLNTKARLVEDDTEANIAPRIRTTGRLAHADLIALGLWKSPRIIRSLEQNDEAFMLAVSEVALSTAE